MRRLLSSLLVIAYCAFGAWTALRQPAPPSPQPAPASPPTFRVYYEKDPVPDAFIRPWAARQNLRVVQTPLRRDAAGEWPRDGDLYIVSPRLLAARVPLQKNPAPESLLRVNPMFTSHAFDPNNELTVPWRWTPYVFYIRQRLSIMMRPIDNPPDNAAAENDSWRALLAGKISSAVLPATYAQLSGGAYDFILKFWLDIPQEGTFIRLDLLTVNAAGEHPAAAADLIAFLLAPEQQHALVTVTGYFPVTAKLGREYDDAHVPLPKTRWLDHSTFIIDGPPAETP